MKKGIHLTTQDISHSRSRIKSTLISPINSTPTDFKPHHYFNQTTKIKSYAQPLQKSRCSNLIRSQTFLDLNNLSLSPEAHSRTRKQQQQCIDHRIKTLQDWASKKNIRHQEQIIAHRMKQMKSLRDKPHINNRSKELYREVSKKKNLDKDIITRFEHYESQRLKKNIDNIVKTYIKETRQVPSIKQLLKSNKQDVMDLMRNMRR